METKRSFSQKVARLFEEWVCEKTYDREASIAGPTLRWANIPTEKFGEIVLQLRSEGWRKIKEYDGFDAWVDHGMMVLERGNETIVCTWSNWEEGIIQACPERIKELRGS